MALANFLKKIIKTFPERVSFPSNSTENFIIFLFNSNKISSSTQTEKHKTVCRQIFQMVLLCLLFMRAKKRAFLLVCDCNKIHESFKILVSVTD